MTVRPRRQAATASRARFLFASAFVVLLGSGPLAAQTATPPTSPSAEREARFNEAVREFARSPRFKGVPEQQVREQIEFVAGNVIFATVHEVGHMLISEMGLAVLGREEDAADAFAVLTGLKLANALSDRVLTQSARGWFLSDRRNQKENIKMVFYDEHGLDRQRAYNIVCLMVGGDPKKFSALADMTKMPEDRQGSCQSDYSNASWSWDKALAPHLRKPDQAKTQIDVAYADTAKYEIYSWGFRRIRLLENLAEHLSDRFAWRGPIALEMTSCNEPGARWDLSARKIFVCYELAADFADLYRDYAVEPKP
jgi:hypothetical protein